VLTVEKLIQEQLEISLAQETVVLLGSAFTTELIKCLLHKIMVVPKHGQPDYAAKIHFCNCKMWHDGVMDPKLLFTSDETWFHLWHTEDPPAIQHVLLHIVKVGVWCAVCA
jgi:hypothetical protein